MKITGKDLTKPAETVVVFPRDNGEAIVFKVRAVRDFSEFNTACPRPEPGMIVRPGGVRERDSNNPKYQEALETWSNRRSAWLFLKSIEPTPDLTWDTVDMAKPETWENYSKELDEAHFSFGEVRNLMDAVLTVNGFNQEAFEEARKRFLAGLAEVQHAE